MSEIPTSGKHIVSKVVKTMHCLHCQWNWVRRRGDVLPKVCPKCKSPSYYRLKIPGLGRPRKRQPTDVNAAEVLRKLNATD